MSLSYPQHHGKHPPTVIPPSLENLSPIQWQQHGEIAYKFARHARHDLANIHCSLGMLDIVQRVQATDNAVAVPDELQPDQIKAKMSEDVKKLVSISNDVIMLSQSTNASAYQSVYTLPITTLLESAIGSRLADEHPPLPPGVFEPLDGKNALVYADPLVAALAGFYFQWTPWLNPHTNASRLQVYVDDDRFTISFPADDPESVASFARRLHSREASPMTAMLEQELSVTTTEFVLWLARFIVLIHGGCVDVNPNDPLLTLHVTLPIVR